MAITANDVRFWRALAGGGHLPRDPRVLEIGQANWYGDVPAADVPEVAAGGGGACMWTQARAFYRGVMGPRAAFTAVDLHGTAEALKLDLNEPLPAILGLFDVVINTGTAEHVFDQCRLFRSIHERTRPGGLMVHGSPLSGWPDHGFYNYHPTLFRDLAAANGYTQVSQAFGEHRDGRAVPEGLERVMPAADLSLFVALRKNGAEPFRVPVQGRYAAAAAG